MFDEVNVDENPALADLGAGDLAGAGLLLQRHGMDVQEGSGGSEVQRVHGKGYVVPRTVTKEATGGNLLWRISAYCSVGGTVRKPALARRDAKSRCRELPLLCRAEPLCRLAFPLDRHRSSLSCPAQFRAVLGLVRLIERVPRLHCALRRSARRLRFDFRSESLKRRTNRCRWRGRRSVRKLR